MVPEALERFETDASSWCAFAPRAFQCGWHGGGPLVLIWDPHAIAPARETWHRRRRHCRHLIIVALRYVAVVVIVVVVVVDVVVVSGGVATFCLSSFSPAEYAKQ